MPRFKIKLRKAAKRKNDRGKTPKRFPYKKAIFSLSILSATAVLFASFYLFYCRSPFFIVRDVVMMGREADTTVNYNELEGMLTDRNIFNVDIRAIRDYMLNNYRELLDLRLMRAFPNSVIAYIILRKPIAQISHGLYYPVDKDGVILSGAKDSPDGKLPIISGIRTDVDRQVGNPTESTRVRAALLLLRELSSSGILDGHKLVEIDISSIRNPIFFLEDGLEVKIGSRDYAAKLENLKKILQDPKIRPTDIRYVDLRFKEPVIGPKWKR